MAAVSCECRCECECANAHPSQSIHSLLMIRTAISSLEQDRMLDIHRMIIYLIHKTNDRAAPKTFTHISRLKSMTDHEAPPLPCYSVNCNYGVVQVRVQEHKPRQCRIAAVLHTITAGIAGRCLPWSITRVRAHTPTTNPHDGL